LRRGQRSCSTACLDEGERRKEVDAAADPADVSLMHAIGELILLKQRLVLAALTFFVVAVGDIAGAAASAACSSNLTQSSAAAANRPEWLRRVEGYMSQGQASAVLDELEQAARSGDRLGLVMLGDILEQGACGATDPVRAAKLYAEAVEKGDSLAALFLGYLYETGSGVSQDMERAKDLYRRSLLDLWLPNEDEWSAVYKASMGWRGISPLLRDQRQWLRSLLADPDRALSVGEHYLDRHQRQGRLACMLMLRTQPMTAQISLRLAKLHLGSEGIKRNLHNARVFSHKAAKAGSAEAHYIMGRLLLDGQPDAPAPKYALVWLLRARDLGVPVEEKYVRQAEAALGVDERRLAEDWAKSPPPPLPRIYGYDPSQPFCAISD
jgi:TPR repeat protein